MLASLGWRRHRRTLWFGLGTGLPALALGLATLPAAAIMPFHSPSVPAEGVVLVQEPAKEPEAPASADAPTSVEELRAAIEEIKAKLARQRAARPATTQPTGLADQLKAAGERITELSKTAEQLRAERLGLQQERDAAQATAKTAADQLAALQQASAAAETDANARSAALDQRLRDVDQAREGALSRVKELEAELAQERTARAAGEEAVERARADLAEATSAREEAGRQLAARETDLGRQADSLAQLRHDLEERDARLATAGEESAALHKVVEDGKATQAELQTQLTAAKDEAEVRSRERAKAMASDVEAARQRAQKLDEEVAALRSIAATSVKEVQSLGEQLLASLKDNQDLTAALGELRATKDMLDGELAASRRETAAAQGELDRLRAAPADQAAARPEGKDGANGALALVRLESTDAMPASGTDGEAAAALLSDLKLSDAGDGWMMTIPEGLEFAPGSPSIESGTTGSLEKVAELIKAYGTPAVRIVGHTDAGGDAVLNRRLSQRRAQAVREFLIERFTVEPRLITTEGYGESRPVATNATAEGRRQNRRVEVYVKP